MINHRGIAPLRAAFAIAFFLATLSVYAADRAVLRDQFRSALAAAGRGDTTTWKPLADALERADYPLTPYVELAALRKRIPTVQQAEVEAFLKHWPDTLAASDLRDAYLREMAKRTDWKTFRALYVKSNDRDLQCDALQARLAVGDKLDFAKDLDALWQTTRNLPAVCDQAFAVARAANVLTDARIWDRVRRSADAGRADAAAEFAQWLGADDRAAADRIVAALRDPAGTLARARAWPDDARTRDAISYAFSRLARRNSSAAETTWADFESRFNWDAAQKNRILYAIALYRSTSYSPDALARLKALPAAVDDDATREWQVRIALTSSDYKETLAALDDLSTEQKADSRWRYLKARVLEKLSRPTEAAPLFREVARDANFYGFLAADRADLPYSICPGKLAADAGFEAALARQTDLARAFEFRDIGLLHDARREWDFAMTKLDTEHRRLSADYAYRRGWYDRAVFAYSADPETQQLYEQRFPLGMEGTVKSGAAAAGIDPAWAYAIIRAESAWMTDAHSHADAYGLMQLLPGVGRQMAKAEGVPYAGAQDLFDADLNIRLGTRYLGQMADKYDGSPWLASAAYNAGSIPVGRWLDARASLDPDFFIETIPYKETRDYVSRVLAFSVIYDWRMNTKVLPLSTRLPRIGARYATPDAKSARKNVVCAKAETPPTATPPPLRAPLPAH